MNHPTTCKHCGKPLTKNHVRSLNKHQPDYYMVRCSDAACPMHAFGIATDTYTALTADDIAARVEWARAEAERMHVGHMTERCLAARKTLYARRAVPVAA